MKINKIPINSIFFTFTLKISFATLFILCTIFAQAQVKIGDNPSTIDSSSLLEMESDTLGILIPRVLLNDVSTADPLKGSIPEGMLIYNQGGTEENGFYYWDGTQYRFFRTSLNTKTRDNYVLVKSVADLPSPSGGIITLASGTLYEINGTIALTSQIDLNGSYIIGLDANNDILYYASSSGSLFTGNNGGTIKNLTLIAPTAGSKVFNLEDLTGAKNLIVRDCIVANSNNIGLLKGFNIVFFNVLNFSGNTNGITYENIEHLLLEDLAWFSNNSNTFEKYVGTFEIVVRLGGFSHALSANSATSIDVAGITSISSGELKNGIFNGDGVRIAGTFSKQWEVDASGIDTEKDDVASGNIYISTVALSTITTVNTPVKALGTTTATNLFRFTSNVTNRLTYDGTKTRSFEISASFSMTAPASNKKYSFYIAKNGSVLMDTRQQRKISNGTDIGALTLTGVVELAPTDYIEVWVENNVDASDITIENMNLSIK